jgi:hypothetical protein
MAIERASGPSSSLNEKQSPTIIQEERQQFAEERLFDGRPIRLVDGPAVLVRVKGSLAPLAGFAALAPDSAPQAACKAGDGHTDASGGGSELRMPLASNSRIKRALVSINQRAR